jgi:hypothetical protein
MAHSPHGVLMLVAYFSPWAVMPEKKTNSMPNSPTDDSQRNCERLLPTASFGS